VIPASVACAHYQLMQYYVLSMLQLMTTVQEVGICITSLQIASSHLTFQAVATQPSAAWPAAGNKQKLRDTLTMSKDVDRLLAVVADSSAQLFARGVAATALAHMMKAGMAPGGRWLKLPELLQRSMAAKCTQQGGVLDALLDIVGQCKPGINSDSQCGRLDRRCIRINCCILMSMIMALFQGHNGQDAGQQWHLAELPPEPTPDPVIALDDTQHRRSKKRPRPQPAAAVQHDDSADTTSPLDDVAALHTVSQAPTIAAAAAPLIMSPVRTKLSPERNSRARSRVLCSPSSTVGHSRPRKVWQELSVMHPPEDSVYALSEQQQQQQQQREPAVRLTLSQRTQRFHSPPPLRSSVIPNLLLDESDDADIDSGASFVAGCSDTDASYDSDTAAEDKRLGFAVSRMWYPGQQQPAAVRSDVQLPRGRRRGVAAARHPPSSAATVADYLQTQAYRGYVAVAASRSSLPAAAAATAAAAAAAVRRSRAVAAAAVRRSRAVAADSSNSSSAAMHAQQPNEQLAHALGAGWGSDDVVTSSLPRQQRRVTTVNWDRLVHSSHSNGLGGELSQPNNPFYSYRASPDGGARAVSPLLRSRAGTGLIGAVYSAATGKVSLGLELPQDYSAAAAERRRLAALQRGYAPPTTTAGSNNSSDAEQEGLFFSSSGASPERFQWPQQQQQTVAAASPYTARPGTADGQLLAVRAGTLAPRREVEELEHAALVTRRALQSARAAQQQGKEDYKRMRLHAIVHSSSTVATTSTTAGAAAAGAGDGQYSSSDEQGALYTASGSRHYSSAYEQARRVYTTVQQQQQQQRSRSLSPSHSRSASPSRRPADAVEQDAALQSTMLTVGRELAASRRADAALRAEQSRAVALSAAIVPLRFLFQQPGGPALCRERLAAALWLWLSSRAAAAAVAALGQWRVACEEQRFQERGLSYRARLGAQKLRAITRRRRPLVLLRRLRKWRAVVRAAVFAARSAAALLLQTQYRRWRARRLFLALHYSHPLGGGLLSDIWLAPPRSTGTVRYCIEPDVRAERREVWAASIKLQTKWRVTAARARYRALKAAALLVQARWRMWSDRRAYTLLRAAVVTLQSFARMAVWAPKWRRLRPIPVILQRHVRGHLARVRVTALRRARCRALELSPQCPLAAVVLQTAWRGYTARKRAAAVRAAAAAMWYAALLVQRAWYRRLGNWTTFLLLGCLREADADDAALAAAAAAWYRSLRSKRVGKLYRARWRWRRQTAANKLQCWWRRAQGVFIAAGLRRIRLVLSYSVYLCVSYSVNVTAMSLKTGCESHDDFALLRLGLNTTKSSSVLSSQQILVNTTWRFQCNTAAVVTALL
jgi:IQ calmodulin-binding motif